MDTVEPSISYRVVHEDHDDWGLPARSGSGQGNDVFASACGHLRFPDADDVDIVQMWQPTEDRHSGIRQICINCADASGLLCDVARVFVDFGLKILHADISTDGQWCLMIFKVKLSSRVPPHWELMEQKLMDLCPTARNKYRALLRLNTLPPERPPFLIMLTAQDRVGVLHDLIDCLWELDLTVFKAHISTTPAGAVLDMFWVYDNRNELPEPDRKLEIQTAIERAMPHSSTVIKITDAPKDVMHQQRANSIHCRTLEPCGYAAHSMPARRRHWLATMRRAHDRANGKPRDDTAHNGDLARTWSGSDDQFAEKDDIQVSIDNSISTHATVLQLCCRDRKGLVYDLMRLLSDLGVRVTYAMVSVRGDGMCEMNVFVEHLIEDIAEDGTTQITSEALQAELVKCTRQVVLLPIHISLRDVYDGAFTELTVRAHPDSACRGRPRVTFDVTSILHRSGLTVYQADVNYETDDTPDGPLHTEVHRFLIVDQHGMALTSVDAKRKLYRAVRAALMGTETPTKAPSEAYNQAVSLMKCWGGEIEPDALCPHASTC